MILYANYASKKKSLQYAQLPSKMLIHRSLYIVLCMLCVMYVFSFLSSNTDGFVEFQFNCVWCMPSAIPSRLLIVVSK